MAIPPPADRSNGYESAAADFIAHRTHSTVGVATVRAWGRQLPRAGSVLDLGCGHGVPIAQALTAEGLDVAGIDASAALLAAFRSRFPHARTEYAAVEDASFFDGRFDGVIAWGLLFLLTREAQERVVRKTAAALVPGGRFLVTAPHQACEWADVLTGRMSRSLGADTYRRLLESSGLVLDGEDDDEGQNHYYFARRPEAP